MTRAEALAVAAGFLPATLTHLHREYPNGLLLSVRTAADLQPPHVLYPAFYGCYDWHSAVHSHWQVARALRWWPEAEFAPAARAALSRSFTAANLTAELRQLERRPGFELPYGLAWLLQLAAELRASEDADFRQWYARLQPLEALAAGRLGRYFDRLPFPIRTGAHTQTAFAMSLTWDWAQAAGDAALTAAVAARARRFFEADVAAPLAYEPSGTDFLSPALAEADLMRRVLAPAEFAAWLAGFWGEAPEPLARAWPPVRVVDYADGQLAHFTGLNLSRAWMLAGVASALPAQHPLRATLVALAAAHRTAGLADAAHPDYMVAHWTPSFAMYLLSQADRP